MVAPVAPNPYFIVAPSLYRHSYVSLSRHLAAQTTTLNTTTGLLLPRRRAQCIESSRRGRVAGWVVGCRRRGRVFVPKPQVVLARRTSQPRKHKPKRVMILAVIRPFRYFKNENFTRNLFYLEFHFVSLLLIIPSRNLQ